MLETCCIFASRTDAVPIDGTDLQRIATGMSIAIRAKKNLPPHGGRQ
jgi:hypothetical protein